MKEMLIPDDIVFAKTTTLFLMKWESSQFLQELLNKFSTRYILISGQMS